ncbi:Transmembrane protein [Parasponia andersonii]|uniref:Transmembrane protein n=1 Tax=Parasponia andersonii TaxID=3476 RepID=A0A2P5ASB9_PARAD|nr:Transmembrane protein [Parasponia andersonii]
MTENSKLELEEKLQKISVSDHINGFHYTTDKSDSFVIDMESFSHGNDKDIGARTKAKLQRSHSRKGPQRGSEKKINSNNTNVDDRGSAVDGPSPRAACVVGSCTPEKPGAVTTGTTDNSSSPQVHHQITITAGNISTVTDGRSVLRRNSFKRSSSCALDPKKVLFLFATLSSMGTILLIYLTLSVSKYNTDENGLDLQQ